MANITADGEDVIFDQGTPSSPRDVFDLVSQALGEQRKAIVRFEVDKMDCLQTGQFPDSFELIVLDSMYHDEIILRISLQLLNQMSELSPQLRAYQGNILTSPWTEVFKQMDQFIAKIQPFADLIDNTSPFVQSYSPPWGDRFTETAQKQANCLNLILNAFEIRNPAGLSQVLGSDLIPLVESGQALFDQVIIPYLKNSVKKHTPEWSYDA
ncbi:MAG: hypothetical protein P8M67_02850 [Opitutales bacterium]|nr:hypothetical protein [Opitutales bacterium]